MSEREQITGSFSSESLTASYRFDQWQEEEVRKQIKSLAKTIQGLQEQCGEWFDTLREGQLALASSLSNFSEKVLEQRPSLSMRASQLSLVESQERELHKSNTTIMRDSLAIESSCFGFYVKTEKGEKVTEKILGQFLDLLVASRQNISGLSLSNCPEVTGECLKNLQRSSNLLSLKLRRTGISVETIFDVCQTYAPTLRYLEVEGFSKREQRSLRKLPEKLLIKGVKGHDALAKVQKAFTASWTTLDKWQERFYNLRAQVLALLQNEEETIKNDFFSAVVKEYFSLENAIKEKFPQGEAPSGIKTMMHHLLGKEKPRLPLKESMFLKKERPASLTKEVLSSFLIQLDEWQNRVVEICLSDFSISHKSAFYLLPEFKDNGAPHWREQDLEGFLELIATSSPRVKLLSFSKKDLQGSCLKGCTGMTLQRIRFEGCTQLQKKYLAFLKEHNVRVKEVELINCKEFKGLTDAEIQECLPERTILKRG